MMRGPLTNIRGLVAGSYGLLFPPRCACCGEELVDAARPEHGVSFCQPCLASFGPTDRHGCPRCGAALPEDQPASGDCPQCKGAKLHFDAVVALGGYHAGLRASVLRMKRPAHDALSLALGRLLGERRHGQLSAFHADLIVPIPMFWRRRVGRGKNSPEVIARCLAESLRLPAPRGVLVRCRNTLPQAGLAPSRRFANVRGAFRVRRPAAIRGARVLLVDDVLTTGATCGEAARVLKQAGAL
ncbi:MAG: double zinc ribbon domain-containing protein, partial [Thermoguttaceae bacterium]